MQLAELKNGPIGGTRLPSSPPAAWLSVISLLLAVLCLLAMVFRQEVTGAIQVWVGSRTYNHCFLILPMSMFLAWTRRDRLSGQIARPWPKAVLLAFALVAVWWVAAILNVLELRQFVVMTLVQVILLGVFGWDLYRRMLAPVLFLYFLVPSGDYFTRPLQDFTAYFAAQGLHLLGIPFYSDGAVIEVRSATFVIAEACAGLRFVIATVALGVFYACETFRSHARRIVFIALCFVIPVLANGLRALGIIVTSEMYGSNAAVVTDHVTYGFVFFSIVLVILILTGQMFSDGDKPLMTLRPAEWLDLDEFVKTCRFFVVRNLALLLTLVAVTAFGPLAIALADSQAVVADAVPDRPPAVGAPWKEVVLSGPVWHPDFQGAERSFSDAISDGAYTVHRYVALYPAQSTGAKLVSSQNRITDEPNWVYVSSDSASVVIDGEEIPVRSTIIAGGNRRRLVFSFYAVGGRETANLWTVKIRQLGALFAGPRCASAFYAYGVDIAGEERPEDVLRRAIAASTPPSAYLCRPRTSTTSLEAAHRQ